MKKIVTALFMVALMMLTASCADPAPERGTITRKVYDDDDSYFSPPVHIPGGMSCSSGMNGVSTCTPTPSTYIPGYWVSRPERWTLWVDDGEDKGIHEVSKDIYERAIIGVCYDHTEDRIEEFPCYKDDNDG